MERIQEEQRRSRRVSAFCPFSIDPFCRYRYSASCLSCGRNFPFSRSVSIIVSLFKHTTVQFVHYLHPHHQDGCFKKKGGGTISSFVIVFHSTVVNDLFIAPDAETLQEEEEDPSRHRKFFHSLFCLFVEHEFSFMEEEGFFLVLFCFQCLHRVKTLF